MISFVIYFFSRAFFKSKRLYFKLLHEFLTISLTLAMLGFASESFVFSDKLNNTNPNDSLLKFLLFGELSLLLPMGLAERYLAHFLEFRNSHFYQTLLGLQIQPLKILIGKTLADSFFIIFRIVVILVAAILFFKIKFSIFSLFFFILSQIFGSSLFLIMAIMASSVHLYMNRGINFFFILQSFAAVVGGAYFPTSVFPKIIQDMTSLLPQTQLLFVSRNSFKEEFVLGPHFFTLSLSFVIFSGVLILINYFLIRYLKRKGKYC